MQQQRPNFLIIVVDEKRYPPCYESPELKAWLQENLRFEEELKSIGTVYHNHYTNTTACAPSRTTLQTGQYPDVHGVTQTDGIALEATDPEMTWLKKWTVPTIGNYFQELGYKTYLKGKWHVSDASIRLENGATLMTFDQEGVPDPKKEAFYLEKNVLSDFGYDGWIGPEPHGDLPLNSGSAVPYPEKGRDKGYLEQVTNLLYELDRGASPSPIGANKEAYRQDNQDKPWLVMANFVNPHDIAAYGLYASLSTAWDFPIDPSLPKKLFTDEFKKSFHDTLLSKPAAQRAYQALYAAALQPIVDLDTYHRLYYTLQKEIDRDLQSLWHIFRSMQSYQNTIVLFMSDHGDLLSAHGNMYQKWFNAYQESIHVPLIISSPLLGNRHEDVYSLTSHIDILPTLLGYAGVRGEEKEQLRRRLGVQSTPFGKGFTLNLPLPGRDLSTGYIEDIPFYFNTQDNPTKGPHQVNLLGRSYPAVPNPASVEAVMLQEKSNLWKLTRYYSLEPVPYSPIPTITQELYNLSSDPMEVDNLYGREVYSEIQGYLQKELDRLSFLYNQNP